MTPEEKEIKRRKRNEYAAKYRKANRAKLCELQKERYKKDPDRYKSNAKKWVAANKDRNKALLRKNYLKRRDELLEDNRHNYRKNKSAYIGRARARERKLKSLTPEHTCKNTMQCFYDCCDRLASCLGVEFHVDHIVPIAMDGKHHPSNLQVMPAILNRSKGANSIFIWAQ